jgi:signal transduction histidine kinase
MADVITGQHSKMLQFLRGAAEELRDPVQVMRLALNAFVPGKPLPPDAVIRHRVTVMSREIDRLGHLLQTYLDASRVEWSRLDLQLGRANVCEIVEHAASMYRAFSAVHQVEVSVPDEPVWIHTDSSRLAQVIHTLVMFAIQSSPRGGVIEVMVGKEEAGVVVEVVDHGGLGIPKEHLGRVFEAFQEIATGRQIGPGTSVAMSVARRIVEAQKGRIEVTSELGEGSTFRVHVPFANSHLKHAPGAEARL